MYSITCIVLIRDQTTWLSEYNMGCFFPSFGNLSVNACVYYKVYQKVTDVFLIRLFSLLRPSASLKATLHIKLNFSHFLLTSCIIVIDSKDHYIFIYTHSGAIKLLGNYSMIIIMMRHCGKLIYYIFFAKSWIRG